MQKKSTDTVITKSIDRNISTMTTFMVELIRIERENRLTKTNKANQKVKIKTQHYSYLKISASINLANLHSNIIPLTNQVLLKCDTSYSTVFGFPTLIKPMTSYGISRR